MEGSICHLMKRFIIVLFAGLLLYACKNSEAPSLAEMGYQPNDLAELKNSPEYVDLSKYEIEEPEETYVPKISPKESDLEDDLAIAHIKYDRPVNGYIVTVDLFDGNFAKMHFEKGSSGFTADVDYFEEPQLYDLNAGSYKGKEIVLKYIPLPGGKMISEDCTFFFSDVDFDGTKELLVREPLAGPRGTGFYHVYELDGKERDDIPVGEISDWTTFNASEKSITQNMYYGPDCGEVLKYRRQQDGFFALTDSTFIEYGTRGNQIVDSVRTHYRKQGEKMVLVKKEVVK